MFPLVESIRLENGEFFHLPEHHDRVIRACWAVFGRLPSFDLQDVLSMTERPTTGLYKVRFLYSSDQYTIEMEAYTPKPIHTLKIVQDDAIEYPHKFLNRENLSSLYEQRGACDDIVIVREGLVTDAYIGNLAFRSGTKWVTPSSCLLQGVMRRKLIEDGRISPTTITEEEITTFDACKVINVMLGFDMPEIKTSKIIP